MPISTETTWPRRGPEDPVSQEELDAFTGFVEQMRQSSEVGQSAISQPDPDQPISRNDEPDYSDHTLDVSEKPLR